MRCVSAVLAFVWALSAGAATTNVWQAAGAKSLRFEVKFLDPKAQVSVFRKCEETKPRVRIASSQTLLPFCARGGTWNAEKGRSEWPGMQLNFDVFGLEKNELELNAWHEVRFIARDNAISLQLKVAGVWREVNFAEYLWNTTSTSIEILLGKDGQPTAEIRNLKAVDSKGPARILEIAPDGQDVVSTFVPGHARGLLRVAFADGAPERWMWLVPRSEKYYCTRYDHGYEEWYPRTCRDCQFWISNPNVKIYTQPYVKAFRPKERAAAIDYAEAHPETAATATRQRFRIGADGTVWLNGQYAGAFTNKIEKVWLYASEIAPEKPTLVRVPPQKQTDGRIVFDLADQLGAKRADDRRAYLRIGDHTEHSDPGQETDHYFDRDGFQGLTDSFVWNVPARCWAKAKVVAAIDPDAAPSNTVPVVTVRLARNDFAGYGNAAATGRIDLASAPRRKVGTAKVGGRDLALYEYETFLSVGDIQDRLYQKYGLTPFGKLPMLQAEIVGPLGRPGVLWDKSQKPDWRARSSALVFGFELSESPCEMELKQSVPGLIFGDDDVRTTSVRVKANAGGDYAVEGTIGDWWGKTVRTFKLPVSLAAGEEKILSLDLKVPEEGWYSLDLKLTGSGTEIIHHANFADVGRDTRKAGYESPFSFWWYGQHHGSTADLEVMGPIFRKMGIRRISAIQGQHTEASMKKYGLTLSQIPFNINLAMGNKPLDQKVSEYEAWLKQTLADFPHVERRALVFHESYCGGDARYLFGEPDKELPESAFGEAKKRYEIGTALCRMIRAKFPDIKIQLGNSSTSYEILDMMFRLKFPSDLFDCLGSETVARFTMPDIPCASSGPNSLWYLNRVADHYGYPQRANVCYEWACHLPRELGSYDSVDWAQRDTLLAFAHGATMVPIGGSTPDDCYFNSDYGGIGSVDRYPYLYPSRGYVARSVLTRELDCTTFVRTLDTGSQTVTALEFARTGSDERVYALWLPRGTATVEALGKGLLGGEKVLKPTRIVRSDAKRLPTIALSTLPVFVTLPKGAIRFRIVSRETPGLVKPRNFQLAAALTEAAELQPFDLTGRHEQTYFVEKKHKVDGSFAVRPGDGCVVIERDATRPAPAPLIPEFGYFALKSPVTLKGEPQTISVEVDGNSSWAELLFVLEDAEGKRHYPTGIAYEGDGKARARVNFDGWGTMQIPFGKKSRVKSSEVVPGGDHWRCDARGKKNRDLVYPVKVIGLGVLMPRDTLSGGRYEPVKRNPNVLKLRNLGVFE